MSRARRIKKLRRSLEAPPDHPVFTRGYVVGGSVVGPRPPNLLPPGAHPPMDSEEFHERAMRTLEVHLKAKARGTDVGSAQRVLYRTHPANGGLVFALLADAEEVAQIHRAISESTTWAEFRRAMPKAEYLDVIDRVRAQCEDMGEPPPKLKDPFNPEAIPGFSDGDYPPWLQADMHRWMPKDILDRFGKRKATFVNGSYVHIDPADLEAVAEALRERGFVVEDGSLLAFH